MNRTRVIKAMLALELTDLNISEGRLKKQYLFRLKQLGSTPDPKKVDKIVNAYSYIVKVLTDLRDLECVVAELKKDNTKLYKKCKVCKGHRYKTFKRRVGKRTCPDCQGTAVIVKTCNECDEDGMFIHKSGIRSTCNKCKGTKIQKESWCRRCSGKKEIDYVLTLQEPCQACGGFGKFEVKPFNAVIKEKIIIQTN